MSSKQKLEHIAFILNNKWRNINFQYTEDEIYEQVLSVITGGTDNGLYEIQDDDGHPVSCCCEYCKG